MLLFDTLHYNADGRRIRCAGDRALPEAAIINISKRLRLDFIRAECVNGDPNDVRWYVAGDRLRGEPPFPEAPRSGSSGPTIPNAQRNRPIVQVTLSPAAIARLDELARTYGSRSAAIEALVSKSR